ncbi:hypothetical protein SARC_16527, partial [Sphaeroforma arctica JP610]
MGRRIALHANQIVFILGTCIPIVLALNVMYKHYFHQSKPPVKLPELERFTPATPLGQAPDTTDHFVTPKTTLKSANNTKTSHIRMARSARVSNVGGDTPARSRVSVNTPQQLDRLLQD